MTTPSTTSEQYRPDPLDMTRGQRDHLIVTGRIVPFGAQYGSDSMYVRAPGVTWGEIYAAIGKQECRDCSRPFPYNPDADRCASCVTASLEG